MYGYRFVCEIDSTRINTHYTDKYVKKCCFFIRTYVFSENAHA